MRRISLDRALGIRQRGSGAPLCLECRHAGPAVLLRLQVRLGARDGRLSRVEIRRRTVRRPRHTGRGNRLTRVAHLLHGRAPASRQAGDTDEHCE